MAIGHFILSLFFLPFFTIIFSVLWGGTKGSDLDGGQEGGGVEGSKGLYGMEWKEILTTKCLHFILSFFVLFVYLSVWHHNLFLAREQGLGEKDTFLFFFFFPSYYSPSPSPSPSHFWRTNLRKTSWGYISMLYAYVYIKEILRISFL